MHTLKESARIPAGTLSMAFSPDKTRLAMSNTDTSVVIWDLTQFLIAQE